MLTDARKTVLVAFGLIVVVAWVLDGNGAADQGVASASDAIRLHQSGAAAAPAPGAAPSPAVFAQEPNRADEPPVEVFRPAVADPQVTFDPAKLIPPRPQGPDFP